MLERNILRLRNANFTITKRWVRQAKKFKPVVNENFTQKMAIADDSFSTVPLNDAAMYADMSSPAMLTDRWSSDLYPRNVHLQNDVTKHSYRPPNVEPKDTSIILFPGTGSQSVGMAKKLVGFVAAKNLFEEASHYLKYDLLDLCLNGSKAELNKTQQSQVSVFVTDMAALEVLKEEKPYIIDNCIGTAGFCVGEFASLVLAGALTFKDALKLVKLRADLMQQISETVPSGLMTIVENHGSKLKEALFAARLFVKSDSPEENDSKICSIAYYMFSQCKVIGGQEKALKFIEDNAEKFNLKCKRLDASGAFHTPLMAGEALESLKDALRTIQFNAPMIYVHSNTDGKPYSLKKSTEVMRKIVRQIYCPVRWEQTIHILYDRDFLNGQFPTTYICGPGSVLTSTLRMTHAKAFTHCHNVINMIGNMPK